MGVQYLRTPRYSTVLSYRFTVFSSGLQTKHSLYDYN